jgi:RNA polymerase sigma-70 factor (ECF subfamily)
MVCYQVFVNPWIIAGNFCCSQSTILMKAPGHLMNTQQAGTDELLIDPESWVEHYGDILFRYALRRVQKRDVAEDLVQETFLAALRARERFEARASERTWLLGILRHKIVDYIRRVSRERTSDNELSPDDVSEDFFDKNGMWAVKPSRWYGDPLKALQENELWDKLKGCLAELPDRMAHAFALRELEELDVEEVSQALEVTTNNLGVILYRARQRLRHCLEVNWLGRSS